RPLNEGAVEQWQMPAAHRSIKLSARSTQYPRSYLRAKVWGLITSLRLAPAPPFDLELVRRRPPPRELHRSVRGRSCVVCTFGREHDAQFLVSGTQRQILFARAPVFRPHRDLIGTCAEPR